MTILNPDHLLEQAERLIQPPLAGAPRQADLRRAVSASYYAVFHALSTAAGDEFVGVTRRHDPCYRLVYRSPDHGKLRKLCLDLKKPTPPAKYHAYLPSTGLGPNIVALAALFVDLQDRRHAADYDPDYRLRRDDAELVIRTARSAILKFGKAGARHRKTFLTLMLFPPRTQEAA